MIIARADLLGKFNDFLKKDAGLIYGAPGAGKSYIVEKVVEDRLKNSRLALLIPVDQLIAGNADEFKSLFHTEKSLVEFLNDLNKGYQEKAVLIFDGLDAARNAEVENNVLGLILGLKRDLDNWGVFATIREFDLFKNDLVKNAFGIKATQKSGKIFYIPELSETEVFEGLKSLGHEPTIVWPQLSNQTQNLLKNPFCLWIFTSLLLQVDVGELSKLSTEVELLDRYFEEIIGRNQENIELLSFATNLMVKDRVLTTKLSDVTPFKSLSEILSSEVMVYSSIAKDRVGFKHNIFFDYFVSCFCFGETSNDFIKFISKDSTYPVFLQPSIKYFFYRLWVASRDEFWQALKSCLASDSISVQLLSRTVPFIPILNNISDVSELQPGIEDSSIKDQFLKFYCYGLKLFTNASLPIRPAIYEFIFKHCNNETFWSLSASASKEIELGNFQGSEKEISKLMIEAYERADKLKSEDNMEFLKSFWILPSLLKTLPHDLEKKNKIVSGILNSIGTDNYSIKEVYKLSTHIEDLILHSPEIAVEVYASIFRYEEKRTDPVSMGSPILPMQTNLRQDYNMTYYQLHESFGRFCESNYPMAMAAAFHAGEGEINRQHAVVDPDVYKFSIHGREIKIQEDYSHIWGGGSKLDEYGLMIVDELFASLESLYPENPGMLDKLLEQFHTKSRKMYFFTHLIELVSKTGNDLDGFVFSVLSNAEFTLNSYEAFSVSQLFEKSYVLLEEGNRKTVEINMWEFLDASEDARKEYIAEDIEQYFSIIPEDQLVLDRSKIASKDGKLKKLRPPRKNRVDVEWHKVEESETLLRQGIDPQNLENIKTLKILSDIKVMEDEKVFSYQSFQEISSEALTVYKAITNSSLKNKFLTDILNSFEKIIFNTSKWQNLDYETFLYFLNEAAYHPEPVFDEKYHGQFDHPHWSPYPRTEAAEFVFKLGLSLNNKSEIEKIASSLVEDPVPSVRYLISIELFRLWYSDKDLFWTLAEKIYDKEPHRSIKLAVLHSVARIFRKDVEKADIFFESRFDDSVNDDMSKFLARSVADLAVLEVGTFGPDNLKEIVSNPTNHPFITTATVNTLLKYVFKTEDLDSDEKFNSKIAMSSICTFLSTSSEFMLSNGFKEENKHVYSVISETILRVYFATDDEKNQKSSNAQKLASFESAKTIMTIVREYLKKGGNLDPHTLYMWSQFSFNLLSYDAKFAIDLVHTGLLANKESGYRLDSMAVKELVLFIERVLSKHKSIIKDDKVYMDKIVEILVIFADVGWPEALSLVWKLDSVYR